MSGGAPDGLPSFSASDAEAKARLPAASMATELVLRSRSKVADDSRASLWKAASSSVASEVFAFFEAAKDAKLLFWRADLEELGVKVKYPFTMLEGNAATVSYQQSTTPYSKLRGVYNLRGNWVLELKDTSALGAYLISCHVARNIMCVD